MYQDAKSNLSGKFSKVIRSLLKAPFDYLASEIKKAMAGKIFNFYNDFMLCFQHLFKLLLVLLGLGTDEDCLTEVRINEIKWVHFENYFHLILTTTEIGIT